jgi:hypothetical protein
MCLIKRLASIQTGLCSMVMSGSAGTVARLLRLPELPRYKKEEAICFLLSMLLIS